MNSIEKIREELMRKCKKADRKILGIWATDCLYNPPQNERIFNCKFIIVQTQFGQGCAYSDTPKYDIEYLENLIGEDCLSEKISDTALKVACIDALSEKIFCGYKTEEIKLTGSSIEKLYARSEIIFKEAEKLIGNLNNKSVLNVGVVGNIIYRFLKSGCKVIGSDFDSTIIGKTYFDKAPIISGNQTLDALKEVDVAVVTGMTIETKTIDTIIKTCKEYNTRLIVFAQTGSNMAQFYIDQGVDCYLSEVYPFYIFNGDSTIKITRKDIKE